MTKQVRMLFGGLIGPDGVIDSRGMKELHGMLAAIPGVVCYDYMWDHYEAAAQEIARQKGSDQTVLVGYSGGGSRATWLSDEHKQQIMIDLMILYDPSPKWQMLPIGRNVRKAICYQNSSPMMFGLGGGELKAGPTFVGKIEVVPIAEQHLEVQYDKALHARTAQAIANLERDIV